MGNNCECCNDEKLAKLQAIIAENKGKQGALIQVLHEAQLIYGYLPIEVQKVIAEGMNIPLAEVYGVVTFYAQFSLKPKGEYKISICLGTACYVKGADLVLDKFKEQLNIEVGDCTADGKFSLDACRCIGACGLAPVLTVNDKVFPSMTPDAASQLICDLREGKVEI